MYQFKTGSKSDPVRMLQEPKPHEKHQVNCNSSGSIFFRKIIFSLAVGCLVASLSGCGGLTMNPNALAKGTAITSTAGTLSKISCGTLSLTGAQSKGCSVYLSAPAKSSTTVSLTSSNSVLRVPASVTVSAGASATGFDAVASAVTKSVSVTITGKAGGVTKTDVITLYPGTSTTSSLKMVSCGTQTLTGPTTKTCSVYLSAAATSGTVVSLKSNNIALTVPTSVIVPAGSASGGFTVSAAAVSTTQTATLTASAGGVSQTAVFQLSGSGTTGSVQHHVQLSWLPPSATSVKLAGYRVYRSASTATSYKLMNSSIDVNTTYTDSTVVSGQTYYYLVKSVDTSGVESPPSNTTSVIIP